MQKECIRLREYADLMMDEGGEYLFALAELCEGYMWIMDGEFGDAVKKEIRYQLEYYDTHYEIVETEVSTSSKETVFELVEREICK
jgi:hypothetical protein